MAIELKRLGKVTHRLENLADRTSRSASAELKKGAVEIAKLAQRNAPRDTGALENSIQVVKDHRGGINGRNAWVVVSNPNKWRTYGQGRRQRVGKYNAIVEKKTRYLERAASQLRETVLKRVKAAFERDIR